jgi:hypothetical protein
MDFEMDQDKNEIDYYVENYPYHVEMFSKVVIEGDILRLYYENGKTSQFSMTELGLSQEIISNRFQNLSGNIVYVYTNFEKTKDIAVELFDLTGCCSGTRKLLIWLT